MPSSSIGIGMTLKDETLSTMRQTSGNSLTAAAISATAVGARRINQIAIDLEEAGFNLDVNVKKKLVTALEKAVADFRAMTVRIYSSP